MFCGECGAGSWSPTRRVVGAQFSELHATVQQERNAHVLERDDLQAERSKLLQAHYVGAVPLGLLKSEQDRIGSPLALLEAQIEAGDVAYELASAHLDDCLALARDCYKLYMSIDDSLRRVTNQAFFDLECRQQQTATRGGLLLRGLKPVMSPV